MDEIDQQILRELTRDAQLPFSRIAKKIGISPKTVQIRYKKLEAEGIILRSSITIDLAKLGYQGKAYLNITNSENQEKKETVDALKQMQNIILITEIIGGDFDVLAIVAVKDFKSIIDLVIEIRKLPSVDQVEVSFTNDTSFPIAKGFNELFRAKKEKDT